MYRTQFYSESDYVRVIISFKKPFCIIEVMLINVQQSLLCFSPEVFVQVYYW